MNRTETLMGDKKEEKMKRKKRKKKMMIAKQVEEKPCIKTGL